MIDQKYEGPCEYTYVKADNSCSTMERDLHEFGDVLIRDPEAANVIKKVIAAMGDQDAVSAVVSGDTPFGIPTNPRTSEFVISDEPSQGCDTLLLYKGQAGRDFAYIRRSSIKKNARDIDKCKVFLPKAAGTGTDRRILGTPAFGPANSVCSQTFLYIPFFNEEEARNFISYFRTKFFRFLVAACKTTQEAPSKVYRFVPLLDFAHPWTDEMLYDKYDLTEEERALIEETIDPMEIEEDGLFDVASQRREADRSQVIFLDRKEGFWVMGKDRLDDYAAHFLRRWCPEALKKPMALPIEDIYEAMGLTICQCRLSKSGDVFGCCFLHDGVIDTYDGENGEAEKKAFSKGIVVIDPCSASASSEGNRRNTLVHEAVHWFKDRIYFARQARRTPSYLKWQPVLCRTSEEHMQPKEDWHDRASQVAWIEWQAHRLAPRILMPRAMFIRKAEELMQSMTSGGLTCRGLAASMADFFKVSRESAVYRLKETGLEERLRDAPDYDEVFQEKREDRENKRYPDIAPGYPSVTQRELEELLERYPALKEQWQAGHFLYADGYLVVAAAPYVTVKEGQLHLSSYGIAHKEDCLFQFRLEAHPRGGLFRTVPDQRTLYAIFEENHKCLENRKTNDDTVNNIYQFGDDRKLLPEKLSDESADRLRAIVDKEMKEEARAVSEDVSFAESMVDLLHAAGIHSKDELMDATGMEDKTASRFIGGAYYDKHAMKLGTFKIFCVAVHASPVIIKRLAEKGDISFSLHRLDNRLFLKIMEVAPTLSLDEVNRQLVLGGCPEIEIGQK